MVGVVGSLLFRTGAASMPFVRGTAKRNMPLPKESEPSLRARTGTIPLSPSTFLLRFNAPTHLKSCVGADSHFEFNPLRLVYSLGVYKSFAEAIFLMWSERTDALLLQPQNLGVPARLFTLRCLD